MANALSIQNGIQAAISGVRNNGLQTTAQASSGVSFQNVLTAAAQGGRKTSALPKGAAQYEAIFDEASRTYGVSKSLLLAVAKQESNFNPNSVSHAGAQGIMQLMPGTAKTLGVKNAFDPYENIMGGAKLLRDNIKSFGSVPLALAAYNAGPGAVKKYGGVPPYKETQDYVKKIMADLGDKFLLTFDTWRSGRKQFPSALRCDAILTHGRYFTGTGKRSGCRGRRYFHGDN